MNIKIKEITIEKIAVNSKYKQVTFEFYKDDEPAEYYFVSEFDRDIEYITRLNTDSANASRYRPRPASYS